MFSDSSWQSQKREQPNTMSHKTVWWECTLLENHCCPNVTGMQREMAAYFSHEAGSATMHYNSRCEKFGLARFLNKSQSIKKSLIQVVCQMSGILECRIFFILQYFFKKQYFLRKLRQTVLVAHSTIFSGKEASCPKN